MSRFLMRVALSAGICLAFAGATPAGEEEIAVRPLRSADQDEILKALDQRTEFDFQKRPLRELVDYLKHKHKVEARLDSKAIGDAGVGTDTPVTLSLKNVSLRSALRFMLMQIDLTYLVRDGCVLITSRTEAENRLISTFYQVPDLIAGDMVLLAAPPTGDGTNDLQDAGRALGAEQKPIPEANAFRGLIDLITSAIAPTSWNEVGGSGSIVVSRRSQAIGIGQTDEVHEEIVALLVALRRVRDEQIAAMKATDAGFPAKSAPRARGKEDRTEEALLEKGDLVFTKLPLIEALHRLSDECEVPLYIDHKAFADAGKSTDTQVTYAFKGLSYKTALTLMLDKLDLAHSIRQDVLLITSKSAAETLLTVKVYPVFNLLVRQPDAPADRPALDFGPLIDDITSNIAPTSWDEVGGPGAIKEFRNSGALVISQTAAIHEKIAEHLEAMGQARAAQRAGR
ncbi:MAG TPA: hypothetical protein VHC22_31275 [Pirellulales bacterium]|nr:hypothetical protein [Pirellulales bacterium]